MTAKCARCGETKPLKARGLCFTDYDHLLRTDPEALADYPVTHLPLADFVADYRIHRGRGLTHHQIAAVMGYAPKTVGRLCTRARNAGLLSGVVTR